MRPTIALSCILKNEVQNLPRLLASVKDCFDEIHLTDTGSTDGSVELIQKYITEGENPSNCPLKLHYFEWVKDFSKARNYAFAQPQTDFLMWLDLDDVLFNREAFISWRDHAMNLADFWLATYHYYVSPEGKQTCSFARERVIRRDMGFTWNYPVHEGMLPISPKTKNVGVQYAPTWAVNHLRSSEDLAADKSRNLDIMRQHKDKYPRLRYYYGKELYENNQILEGFTELVAAIADPTLELHDRVMGIQYAALCAMRLNEYEKAIQLAHTGMQLAPHRAEMFVIAADAYLKLSKPLDAVPLYLAATGCKSESGGLHHGPIFVQDEAYTHYPLIQLARVFANMGDLDKAEMYAEKARAFGKNAESDGITKDLATIRAKIGSGTRTREKTTDIIISCPPGGLYEWDGEIYRAKGVGGSETAAVEVCEWLAKLTNRKVMLFNQRQKPLHYNGVDYRPAQEIAEYLRDYEPAAHVAWRHTTKLSADPYYVWCHDLGAIGIEGRGLGYKVFALSEFHKHFLQNMFAVPQDRIVVTRNGINPLRYPVGREIKKVPGKVIYSSSPDRGLLNALRVMDEVVKGTPEAKLHVYYGFENMYKMGMGAQADDLKREAFRRDYVVYHGNLTQEELTREFDSACVWLYPTNFLETYCITAIEALCSRVYPVVRRWGALPHTLKEATDKDMATVLASDCVTQDEINLYALHVHAALREEKWRKVSVNPYDYSWEKVAQEWSELLCLPPITLTNSTTAE